ncbi:hypothetical protein G5I_02661 [Acromyrmex echinatior]|uniref:Endonuclease/exonuclease/phosphatase domain-containing protein n=1 Tax=Acromyrmex echinatior TaxID=103372 RepID=F4WAW7_ACREC|nr:hypothetical protein G5I_02661 [Acromyrmex echinatior]
MSPNKPVSIANWNCRGLRGKLPEIQANDYIYDLWCLQEIMVTENTYLHSNIFNFVTGDIRRLGQHGVAIAIKKSLRFDLLDLTHLGHHSIELIGIKLYTQGPSFIIINIQTSVVMNSSYGY